MNVGLTAEKIKKMWMSSGPGSLASEGQRARGDGGEHQGAEGLHLTKNPNYSSHKSMENVGQSLARPSVGSLTANVRPQLVVIVLQQRVEDLRGISLLCLGGEDPGFIDAEVIVIILLCALTPGAERQKERDITVTSLRCAVGVGAQLAFRDPEGGRRS